MSDSSNNLHWISVEEVEPFTDANSGWNSPEEEMFRKMVSSVPSRALLSMKEGIRESEWEAKAERQPEDVLEGYRRKVSIIDSVLADRPKFSVLVEKLSYDASGAEERLHNLPSTRTVDLYIDVLEEEGFSIAVPEDGSGAYPVISSKDKVQKILNLTFYWGQNDFQSKPVPSVSVGDVVHLRGRYHRVASIGFEELTIGEYAQYKEVPARDRTWSKWREAIS